MAKKILILLVIVLIFIGAWGFKQALDTRESLGQPHPIVKAPQTSITLVEGWNNNQIANYLQQKNIVQSADFLAAQKSFDISDYPLLASKPAKADLEGFIFPDTYFIPQTAPSGTAISDIILKKALDNFAIKITPEIQAAGQANGLNLYQLITLASIIEKETGANMDDKKTVAGIFYNRLHQGMALQSDATIAFITGRADVSTADTQVNSPYNTYIHTGLPTGPICNPSLNSILAAAYPNQTDYLYFLTDPGTGRAVFAQTYDQHLANKAKYLK